MWKCLAGFCPPSKPVTRVTSDNNPTTIDLLSNGAALSRSLSTRPPAMPAKGIAFGRDPQAFLNW